MELEHVFVWDVYYLLSSDLLCPGMMWLWSCRSSETTDPFKQLPLSMNEQRSCDQRITFPETHAYTHIVMFRQNYIVLRPFPDNLTLTGT